MKILFCIDSMYKGGAEHVMSGLCNHFSNDNEVSLLYINNFKICYDLNTNIGKYCLDEKKKNQFFIFRNLSRFFKTKSIIKKVNPDIIVTFLPKASFLLLFCNYFNKRKIIVSERADPTYEYNTFIKKIIMKIFYRRSNGFVVQTNYAKKYYKSMFNKPIVKINNPLDKKFLIQPYKKKRVNEIVSVGRLSIEKNQILLINAFAELIKEYPDYKLIIYGEGKERNNLENEISKLNLVGKVLLPGNVDDIVSKIYRSSLFVLSSNHEGMPNALLEAMSLGLPVISTNCFGDNSDEIILNNINGILISKDDKNGLLEAMTRIIANDEFSIDLGKNAVKIRKQVDPDNVYEQWNYFFKIVNKR